MIHHKLFAASLSLAAAEGIIHALQHGILGVGAFCGALAAIYIWVLRPLYHFARQTARIHGVLLGDADHKPLNTRLTGIEGDVKDMSTRLGSVESSLDVIASQERKDVMDALAQSKPTRRGKAA